MIGQARALSLVWGQGRYREHEGRVLNIASQARALHLTRPAPPNRSDACRWRGRGQDGAGEV